MVLHAQNKWRRRLKVVLLPFDVGGNSTNLLAGFKQLECKAELWTFTGSGLGKQEFRAITPVHRGRFYAEWQRLVCLGRLFRFDLIVYTFGSTLFAPKYFSPAEVKSLGLGSMQLGSLIANTVNLYFSLMQLVELSLLKALGKRTIAIFQGSDGRLVEEFSRLRSIDYAQLVGEEVHHNVKDALKKRNSERLAKYVDKVYVLNPDLLSVVPKSSYMPYAFALDREYPIPRKRIGSPIRIGHAPSHRGVKGTDRILQVISQLHERQDLDIELVLIENVDHADALGLYETLDFMVDQINIGWFGVLAVECSALGVPTIASIAAEDLALTPKWFQDKLGVISSSSEDLAHVLLELCKGPSSDYQEASGRAIEFARIHEPVRVALQILRDLDLDAQLKNQGPEASFAT